MYVRLSNLPETVFAVREHLWVDHLTSRLWLILCNFSLPSDLNSFAKILLTGIDAIICFRTSSNKLHYEFRGVIYLLQDAINAAISAPQHLQAQGITSIRWASAMFPENVMNICPKELFCSKIGYALHKRGCSPSPNRLPQSCTCTPFW